MKRGGPLKRYSRLVNRSPLRRYTELRSSSVETATSEGRPAGGGAVPPTASTLRSRAGHRLPVDVVAVVKARSGGWCEIAIEGVCSGAASQRHHRITQKAGGRHGAAATRSDRVSNVLDGCSPCHDIVTDHPRRAYTYGWSLKERQDSAMEPVLYRGVLSYLADDGRVVDVEKAGA